MNRLSVIASLAATDDRVSDSEFRTLAVIAAHANQQSDGWCYPAYKTVGELRGLGKRTIRKHVAKLRELGYIKTVERRREDGGRTSNWIQIRYDISNSPDERSDVPPRNSREDTPPGTLERTDIKDKQVKDNKDSSSQKNATKPTTLFGTENGNGAGTVSPIGDSEPKRNSRQQAIHELEQLFCTLTKLKPPPRNTKKQQRAASVRWWGPLGTIYSHLAENDLDEAKRLVTLATTRMQNEKLTISAPQSIEQVANHIYAELASKPRVEAQSDGNHYLF